MSIHGAFSLLEAAAKFEAFSKNIKLSNEAILTEWAVLVRDKAKEAIGTYRYGWPELADSTQADREHKGFPADQPLLRTGELLDSIQASVQMHGEDGVARVGSNNDKAVWHEIGTSRIPPRPFLLNSVMASKKDIGRIANKFIRAAWLSAGHDNELSTIF